MSSTPDRLGWPPTAWEDVLCGQGQDRRQLRHINQLIHACLRNPLEGIGKSEPLRENLPGCWSRRIVARQVAGVRNHELLAILP